MRPLLTAAVTAILLSVTSVLSVASDFRFRGYTGGMMLHSGYIQSHNFEMYAPSGESLGTMQIRGGAVGIGGQVKFAFGTSSDLIRIGSEGHSSTVTYSPAHSYAHIGWGGILVDYIRQTKGRVHPYIGVTVGGGGVKNHMMADGSASDFVTEPHMALRKYAFMAVTPFVGMEISLTPKLRMVVKADWIINTTSCQSDFPCGARLYLGIMFNRLRD
ncbi:MAG TPA: hypothetical protein IAC04_00830 [Candidatus Coprenecus stercoravium]|uniref:Uncharacterized protein n=1 Tax=Candidatus Coprenecus stercoravium TaxID=2840735 RepID=A0A9D2GMU6_9BACT|nr:hypothetical protein [Candidatus Coprenecus stercoravium]